METSGHHSWSQIIFNRRTDPPPTPGESHLQFPQDVATLTRALEKDGYSRVTSLQLATGIMFRILTQEMLES